MPDARPAPVAGPLPRGHLLALNRSFRRTLEAENKSPRTIEAYTDAVRLLATYCQAHGHDPRWQAPPGAHPGLHRRPARPLEAGYCPQPLPGPARLLQVGGVRGGPPGQPDEWNATAAAARTTCRRGSSRASVSVAQDLRGRDFTSRRDTAIVLLLVDTGMRRAECVGMTLDDVDLDRRIVWVLGKGRRPRALPIGRKTAQALDRYLRVREGHRLAYLPHLWAGRNGPMTPSGVYQVVHNRARAAGLAAMHPYQLRHAFATSWLAEGGNENELMLVAGWKSRTMIDRYTKATAVERARASHARLSPADRL